MRTHRYLLPAGLLAGLLTMSPTIPATWGFFAHRKINRSAIFTLPSPMIGFYKNNLDYITAKAVNADKRRYVLKEEAARHYFDAEHYRSIFPKDPPLSWREAEERFPASHFQEHGVLPWHIVRMTHRLTNAFRERDSIRILRYSADLGHYLADAHVPLHTTDNYNGQLTGQTGIHALWESRLPELFTAGYDLFTGKARYIGNIREETWRIVRGSHHLVDSVLIVERKLSGEFPGDRKYTVYLKNNRTVKNYSERYSALYQKRLQGMVERRLRRAILTVGSYWYTAWVNAGQPSLKELEYRAPGPEEKRLEKAANHDPTGRSMLGRKE